MKEELHVPYKQAKKALIAMATTKKKAKSSIWGLDRSITDP